MARTFSTLCGIHDPAYDVYLATYFSTRTIEWAKWLRSYPLDMASLAGRTDSEQTMLAIRLGGHKDLAPMAMARNASDTASNATAAQAENEVRAISARRDLPSWETLGN